MRNRPAVAALFVALLLGPACAGDTFARLEPGFFPAANVAAPHAAAAIAAYERRLDAVADGLLARADVPPAERAELGRQLFYAGFFPHVAVHAVEDGYLRRVDVTRPPRYGRPSRTATDPAATDAAAADDAADQAELVARMRRSDRLLARAAELRPADGRITTTRRSVRFVLDVLERGAPTPATLDALVEAARADRFSAFAALVLVRDPALHPLDAPYMERLFAVVCGPSLFDCDRRGPPRAPPPAPAAPPRRPTLTQDVNGPVLLADLLVRRAEMLVRRADAAPPEARAASLGEATGRAATARALVSMARRNAARPELAHDPLQDPAHDALSPRAARIDALLAAIDARRRGAASSPLPDGSYYATRAYRAPYQCASCHTRAPGAPGVPQ